MRKKEYDSRWNQEHDKKNDTFKSNHNCIKYDWSKTSIKKQKRVSDQIKSQTQLYAVYKKATLNIKKHRG